MTGAMAGDRLLRTGVVIARTGDCIDVQVSAPCQTCKTKCGFGHFATQGIITRVACRQPVAAGHAILVSASRRGLTRVSATLFLPAIGVFVMVMIMSASGAADSLVAVTGSITLLLALLCGSFAARAGDRWLDIEFAMPVENSSNVGS